MAGFMPGQLRPEQQTQTGQPQGAAEQHVGGDTLLENSLALIAFHRVAVEKITAIRPLGIHWLAV